MMRLILVLSLLLPVWTQAGPADIQRVVGMAKAAGSAWTIEDAFATNTASNYTSHGAATLLVAAGVAHRGQWGDYSAFYSNTTLGGATQTVQGLVQGGSAGGWSFLMVRSSGSGSGSTGVMVAPGPTGDRILVDYITGQTKTDGVIIWLTGGKTWGSSVTHLVEVSVTGTTLSVKIDWNDNGVFTDANESDMGIGTISTTTGNYAGFGFYSNGVDASIDNFKAKTP